MIEEWRNIDGYPNYQVSNFGRIKSLNYNKTGVERILVPHKVGKRKKIVLYRKGYKPKTFFIYRLEWEAFNGKIPEGMVINHLDENPSNDVLTNLEVCTQKENMNYGGCQQRRIEKRCLSVAQYNNGVLIKIWKSIKEARESLGCSKGAITNCLKGRTRKTMGYEWRYYNVY